MKKLLFVLALFFSINASAHHLDALGWCTLNGKAIFTTVLFSNNLNVEVQYKPFNASGNNDPWLTGENFNTPVTGSTVHLISLPQPNQTQVIKVRFRYKSVSSNSWGSWSTSQNSSTSAYAGCGSLPVIFSYFKAEAITSTYFKIEFTVESGEDSQMFVVTVSEDGTHFKSVAVVMPDAIQPSKKYTVFVTIN